MVYCSKSAGKMYNRSEKIEGETIRTIESLFDLAQSGQAEAKLDFWLSELIKRINRDTGAECGRAAVYIFFSEIDTDACICVLPKERVSSLETDVARKEAFRLQRIAVAGGVGGASSSRPTSIVVPLSNGQEGRRSWIELEMQSLPQEKIAEVIDLVGMSFGWVAFLQSEMHRAKADEIDSKAVKALGAVVSLTTEEHFTGSIRALVTDIADRFNCDRVSIGLSNGKNIKVMAISHTGKFSRSMVLARRLRAAMEEAFDQKEVLIWPPRTENNEQLLTAQAELAEKDQSKDVLTIPLFDGIKQHGAIVLEKSEGKKFTKSDLFTLEALSGVVTPLVVEKRNNDRWIITHIFKFFQKILSMVWGRKHFAVKLICAAIFIIGFLLVVVERPLTVVAPAVVQGAETRTITAAFDGFLSEAVVREGDRVATGDILLRLDDRDFNLERLRLSALLSQAELELDRAISARDRAEAALIEARVRQLNAQLELVEQQIERSILKAPFDALIISGDLTRSVGRAVSRGEELLALAPLDEYRVVLDASEQNISKLKVGQIGELKLSAIPERNFTIKLRDMVPVARYENNSTVFSVETEFVNAPIILLHGMSGSARIYVDEVPLYVLWGKPLWDRIREWIWRNVPY